MTEIDSELPGNPMGMSSGSDRSKEPAAVQAARAGVGGPGSERAPAEAPTGPMKQHRPTRKPPAWTRCAVCGHAGLSAIPTFSAGSGIAARPFADDVYCHGCGHIGLPAIVVG